jgi:DNA-binding response OmpR family regulator
MTKKKKKLILIVEDEKALTQSLESALKETYEIALASTGQEGIEQAQRHRPDLILLDIQLPDINGIEVLQQLKHNAKTELIPVMILTNLGDADTVGRILKAGGTTYLVKSDHSLDEVARRIDQEINPE